MTNGWVDMKNTDMMLIMGGNPAENHPCGFKWPVEAKRTRNAKIISVDPRFTRTSAVADLFTSIRKDGDMKKAGTIIYAVGWTQHTFGTQIIRTAAMLQLLLGNVGRAGGGVNALRGHSNIQGATDMAGIFDNLPGYLKMPNPNDKDFATYAKRITPTAAKPKEWDSFNYWSNTPKFAVSLLKALYGDAAKPENDWAFHYLPKIAAKYSWGEIWDNMYKGKVKGLMAWGMNGVAIGPNSNKNIEALKRADWLVVCDIYPEETSSYWQSPGITE